MTKQPYLPVLLILAALLMLPFAIHPGSAHADPFPPQPYPTGYLELDPIEYEVDGSYANESGVDQPAGATVTINGTFINIGEEPAMLATLTHYWNRGIINLYGTFHCTMNGWFRWTLVNDGQVNIFTGGEIRTTTGPGEDYSTGPLASVLNRSGGVITNAGLIHHLSTVPFLNEGTLNNNGTLNLNQEFDNSGVLDNNGTVELSGELTNSGEVNNNVGATMETAGSYWITNEAEGIFTNDGTIVPLDIPSQIDNHGVFYNRGETGLGYLGSYLTNTGTFHNTGTISSITTGTGSLTFDNQGEVVNDGLIDFGTIPNLIQSNTGTYGGSGTYSGDFNNAGTVAPGTGAGAATIDGNYTQTAEGTLSIEIGGLVPVDEHDVLTISGGNSAALAGTLEVTLLGGFVPVAGNSFDILSAAAVTGEFDTRLLPDLDGLALSVEYGAGFVRLNTLLDSDNDGVPDIEDGCPLDPQKSAAGQCGCGVADTDSDSDGTADCNDNCPNDPAKIEPGTCGCGVADTDTDNDGTPDCDENTSSGGGGGGSSGCFIDALMLK